MKNAPLRMGRRLRAGVCALLLGSLALPASAQMHEFTGRVRSVDDGHMVVGNRMGDKLSFARTPKTRVRGAKGKWEALRPADRVTVHWEFGDRPAQARRVIVLPPR